MSETPPTHHTRDQRGLALISVLWIAVLLSVLAGSVLYTGRTEVMLTRNLIETSQAETLANGAVEVALLGLLLPPDGGGWRADGTVYAWRGGTGEVRVRITEEITKVDLNDAPIDVLANLLRRAGKSPAEADALAAAIADFRDEDSRAEPNGAEDPDYEQEGGAYGAKDAPFESVSELQQVLGMEPSLYRRLAPAVTIYSGLAAPENLFGDEQTDEQLLDQAIEPPARQEDREPIDSLLPTPLIADTVTDAPSPEELAFSAGLLLVRAEARLPDGANFVREAVVEPIAGALAAPYLILEWRQGTL